MHALFEVIGIEEQKRGIKAIDQKPRDGFRVRIFTYIREAIYAGNLSQDRVVRSRSAPYEKNQAQDHSEGDPRQYSYSCDTEGRDDGKTEFRSANVSQLPHTLEIKKRCTCQNQHGA